MSMRFGLAWPYKLNETIHSVLAYPSRRIVMADLGYPTLLRKLTVCHEGFGWQNFGQ
jgi:hypothetical protein